MGNQLHRPGMPLLGREPNRNSAGSGWAVTGTGLWFLGLPPAAPGTARTVPVSFPTQTHQGGEPGDFATRR